MDDMTGAIFDESRTEHRKALRKLEHDLIAWFTTVSEEGEPHSVPVWFFWQHGRVIVLSEPNAMKVHHVRHGSPVLVHLESGRFGDDVVVLNGTAEISDRNAAQWFSEIGDAFGAKYSDGIEDFGMGLGPIAEKYSTVMVVTPTKLMAW